MRNLIFILLILLFVTNSSNATTTTTTTTTYTHDTTNFVSPGFIPSLDRFYWTNHRYGDLNHDGKCDDIDVNIWNGWDSISRIHHKQRCYQIEKKSKAVSSAYDRAIVDETSWWEFCHVKTMWLDLSVFKVNTWNIVPDVYFSIQVDFHYDPNTLEGEIFINMSPFKDGKDAYAKFTSGKDEIGDYFSYNVIDSSTGLNEFKRVDRTSPDGKLYLSYFPGEETIHIRYIESNGEVPLKEISTAFGSLHEKWHNSFIYLDYEGSLPSAYLGKLIFKYAYKHNSRPSF